MMNKTRAIFRQERSRQSARLARDFMDLAKSATRKHMRLQYLTMAYAEQHEAARQQLLAMHFMGILNALDG